MIFIKNSLLLSVELFSLFLEDLEADGLMFRNTVRVEFPSTSHRTLNKSRWIILDNLNIIGPIYLFETFFLKIILNRSVVVRSLLINLLLSEWRPGLSVIVASRFLIVFGIEGRLLAVIVLIVIRFGLLGSVLDWISG
jgi:hypothetical protein